MQTTQSNPNAMPTDNLTTELHRGIFYPMESIKGKAPASGNRYCKLIKKGENSKLPESLAVEIPDSLPSLETCAKHPAIATYLEAALRSLQDAQVKAMAVAGAKQVQYVELSVLHLETFAAEYNQAGGIGQLSEERIVSWFETDARDMLLVALADRLGLAENATDADVKRLEQIANQTRDNLKKLSSKKPVHFDERVVKALNWALDVTEAGDIMTGRLRDKLNLKVEEAIDMADALGF